MDPEKQRIAIAKVCGWIAGEANVNSDHSKAQGFWHKQMFHTGNDALPNYLFDLNAMHGAEKMAGFHENSTKGRKLTQKYAHSLGYHTESWKGYATASQRAEAFLRCLNLWEE